MGTNNNTAGTVVDYPVVYWEKTFTFAGESSGEIVQMFDVRDGDKVVWVTLKTADLGTAVTLIVGDGASTARYIASFNTDSISFKALDSGTGVGHEYTSDDTIDVVTGNNAATGEITLGVFIQRTYD